MTQPANVPANMTLTLEQYTSLVALARVGAQSQNGDQLTLENFLITIEKANGVTRYLMWVRWQEKDQPLPPTASFPRNWPPNLQQVIQKLQVPVSYQDVQNILSQYAQNPINVMVTPDPNAALGWLTLTQAFPGETH